MATGPAGGGDAGGPRAHATRAREQTRPVAAGAGLAGSLRGSRAGARLAHDRGGAGPVLPGRAREHHPRAAGRLPRRPSRPGPRAPPSGARAPARRGTGSPTGAGRRRGPVSSTLRRHLCGSSLQLGDGGVSASV